MTGALREMLGEARAALTGQPQARRVLAVAAVARLHVGGLSLVILLLVKDVSGSLQTAGAAVGVLSLGVGAARPLQGRLIDRLGHSTLSVAGGLHLGLSAITAGWAGVLPTPALFGLCLALGFTTPAVSVATGSAWSRLLAPSRQPAMFAFDAALQDAAYFFGPLAAGGAAAAFGPQRALLAIAVVALAGGWALARLVTDPSPADGTGFTGIAQRLGPIARLLAAMVGLGVVYGTVAVAAVAAALEAGHEELSGPVTAALFAGGAAGELLIAPRRPNTPLRARLGARLATLSLATLALPLAFAPALFAAAVVGVGAALGAAQVTVQLGIAAGSGALARGEAFGWSGASIRLGNAIGAAVGGFAVTAAGPSLAFLVATAGAVAALLAVRRWSTPPAVSDSARGADRTPAEPAVVRSLVGVHESGNPQASSR